MEILARGVRTLASTLDGVEAAHDASALNLDVRRRMGEPAVVVWTGAFVPRELATDLERQPTRVLDRPEDHAVLRRRIDNRHDNRE